MEKRFRKWLILTVLIVVAWIVVSSFLANCNWPKINRADVVGSYVNNYEEARRYSYIPTEYPGFLEGIHRLVLKDDGTYDYEFTSFDGKESIKKSNTWTFEYSSVQGNPEIVLQEFGFGPIKVQNQKGHVTAILPVTRWFGHIRITIHYDYGYYFRKEK